MKKIYILLFAVSGLLFSCSTDGEGNTKDPVRTKTNMGDFDQIVQIDDINDQIIAASALTIEGKVTLWHDKIQNYIANNVVTASQVNYLNELKSQMSNKNIFIDGHPERINFIENKSDFYIQKAQELFGENEGWYLLHRVENLHHRIAALPKIGYPGPDSPGPGPNGLACNCVAGSYCIKLIQSNNGSRIFINVPCDTGTCVSPPVWGVPAPFIGKCRL